MSRYSNHIEDEKISITRRILLTLPIILSSLAIFIVSFQERIELPEFEIFGTDKILHFFAYFVYGISVQLLIHANFRNFEKQKKITYIIIISFLYAISDEAHQYFVPGRDADIYDLIADFAGSTVSLLLYSKIYGLLRTYKIIR